MEFHAFSCKTCDDSFEKRESLPWHEEVFHAFTCKTCGEKFASKESLDMHETKHNEEYIERSHTDQTFHVTHVVTNS